MREWKKCANPDCYGGCKKSLRCAKCTRWHIYRCQNCKTDLPIARKVMCKSCSYSKRLAWEKNYQKKYSRNYYKNVTLLKLHNDIPLIQTIPSS